jgi:cbb3-type cytochrome oxidase subunit 1
MTTLALRFVKWGTAFLVLGVWTGYGPLAHYLHGGVEVACPWAPVHGHVVLLGWLGFTVFGLVYRALGGWGKPRPGTLTLVRVHFWLSTASVLGVYANGIFGYRYLDRRSPGFYYRPDQETLRLWLSIDGLFLTLFALGAIVFLWVVFRGIDYEERESPSRP